MIKLLILTLAAAALGAGVPQAPRPEKTLRNPTDMDMEMERIEKRDVEEGFSYFPPRPSQESEVFGVRESRYLESPNDPNRPEGIRTKRELLDEASDPRRQPNVPEYGPRIEKRDVIQPGGPRDREAKYLESLELQPTPSRKFETRSMKRVYF